MTFTFILIVATMISAAVRPRSGWRDRCRRGMALAMLVAGISHLARPEPFVQHLPDWVPGRHALVAASGIVELLFGVALIWPRSRRATVGRLLSMYLVAVFPANVYVAMADVDVDGQPDGVYAWLRLPLQAVFIAWALWSTQSPHRRPMSSQPVHRTTRSVDRPQPVNR